MFTVDLHQVAELSGIPSFTLEYDARHGRLPVTKVRKAFHIPLATAQKIVDDPAAYLAWRTKTSRGRKRVVFNGVIYPSVVALARALRTTRPTVYAMIKDGTVTYVEQDHTFF